MGACRRPRLYKDIIAHTCQLRRRGSRTLVRLIIRVANIGKDCLRVVPLDQIQVAHAPLLQLLPHRCVVLLKGLYLLHQLSFALDLLCR